MSHLSYHDLTHRARRSLTAAPGHRKLVLISIGVSTLLGALVTLCNLLLEQGIGSTGGLSGLGTRSVLTTAQSLLSLATMLALPFWELGYTGATLKLAREERPRSKDLLDGFRIFFPALRLFLLTGLLYLILGLLILQIGSMVLSATPLAAPLYRQLLPVMLEGGDPTAVDPAQLTRAMLPILIGCAVLCLVVMVPVSYRLRMAQLRLLDAPEEGALKALLTSNRLMKGNCLSMLKVDLHFWWFGLARVMLLALGYGDVLLSALGVSLPISPTAAYFAFYLLAIALQLILYTWTLNPIRTAYAHAYLTLQEPEE